MDEPAARVQQQDPKHSLVAGGAIIHHTGDLYGVTVVTHALFLLTCPDK